MRLFLLRCATPALCALLAATASAASLDPPPRAEPRFRPHHDGFYAALGAGVGTAQLRANGDGSARETGPVVRLRAGWALTPQFTVVLEGSAWRGEEHPGHSILGAVTAGGFYYPARTVPVYFRFGAGPVVFDVEGTAGSNPTSWGVGGVFGVGYDVGLGDAWALTPALDADLGGFDGFSSNVYALTVTITRH